MQVQVDELKSMLKLTSYSEELFLTKDAPLAFKPRLSTCSTFDERFSNSSAKAEKIKIVKSKISKRQANSTSNKSGYSSANSGSDLTDKLNFVRPQKVSIQKCTPAPNIKLKSSTIYPKFNEETDSSSSGKRRQVKDSCKAKKCPLNSDSRRSSSKASSSSHKQYSSAKIPPYDGTYDAELFCTMVEDVQKLTRWNDTIWLTHIVAKLQGPAKDVFLFFSQEREINTQEAS